MEARNPTYPQLWDAAQQGRADEVREILRASQLHGGLERVCLEFALSVACCNNWPRAAQALLDAKARPDVWTHPGRHPSPLYAAAYHGHVEVLRALRAHLDQVCYSGGDRPLHVASAHGQTDVVRYLVSANANPRAVNHKGETPLKLATR